MPAACYATSTVCSLYVNTTHLDCKHFKCQTIVEILSLQSFRRKLCETIAAASHSARSLDIELPLIEAVQPIDHRAEYLHRRRWRMLRFGDAATFHQPSLRNIATQADAKWAFIAGIRRACGTRELTSESGRSLRDEVKKKSINRIENTHGLATQPRTESETSTAPKHSSWGEQRSRKLILSPSCKTFIDNRIDRDCVCPEIEGRKIFQRYYKWSTKINYKVFIVTEKRHSKLVETSR